MTQVHGATVTLKEGQIWETKKEISSPWFDEPTVTVRILAIGKTHLALEDVNCDSHFITTVMDNDTFARSFAWVLIKENQEE